MLELLGYISVLANWPTILLITLVSIYFYSTRNYNYWKNKGVDGPKPVPFIGNLNLIFKEPRVKTLIEEYKKYGKIYGIYEGQRPLLMVAEPDLLRDIFVKDFNKFVDRGLPPFGHPIFDRGLFNARGDHWKQIRVTVSPTFSTAKMRKMHKLIKECVQRLDSVLEKVAKSDNNNIVIKQMMTNYTMDVIALAAFATKVDTYSGEVHPFVENAQSIFKPSPRAGLFFLLTNVVPTLVKKYNFSLVPKHRIDYFESVMKTIISERESHKESKCVDFLQILIDAKNKSDNNEIIDEDINEEIEMINKTMKKINFKFEDMDIMSTSTFFILAGSESTSNAISHLLHELALNPDIQNRLYEEVKNYGKSLDYDAISQLHYLDACLNESLRKYPAVVFNQRQATEDYVLGDTGLTIPKGSAIRFPTYAIHHDPEYFPDPEKFNPERFMPENKFELLQYTFLPFGAGPRMCVGMRFALMNVKTVIISLLSKYRFIQTADTKTEFEYKKFVVAPQAIDMGTVGLELRN